MSKRKTIQSDEGTAMNRLLALIPLLALLAACDAPVRGRAVRVINGEGYSSGGNWTSGTAPGTGVIGDSSGNTSAPGFESCDLSAKHFASALGGLGLCQSTQTETLFRFRPSFTDSSTRTCLIPTHKDPTGSSTYIGQPQCAFTEANKTLEGQLHKNRQGFSHLALNGVMIMKQNLLTEYYNCMHGYSNWLQIACPGGPATNQYCHYWIPNCPHGAQSSGACDRAAQDFRQTLCNNFKNNNSNAYLDIRTR
jgi:hypothetical protein